MRTSGESPRPAGGSGYGCGDVDSDTCASIDRVLGRTAFSFAPLAGAIPARSPSLDDSIRRTRNVNVSGGCEARSPI